MAGGLCDIKLINSVPGKFSVFVELTGAGCCVFLNKVILRFFYIQMRFVFLIGVYNVLLADINDS